MLFNQTDHEQEIQRNGGLWGNTIYTKYRARYIRNNISYLKDQKEPAVLISISSIAYSILCTYMIFKYDFGQILNIVLSAMIFIPLIAFSIKVAFSNHNIDNQIAQQEKELEELFLE